jgi:TolB-like protein/DNA-binding SARP family transcriptional activator
MYHGLGGMESTVERTVGIARELRIRLLGPVAIHRADQAVPLPRSRKVQALLAFLALGGGPFTRSRLCDLLWDVPNDPRGELRWCLSKLRGLLDDDRRKRVVTVDHDRLQLDLSDCEVDAIEIDRLTKQQPKDLSDDVLSALSTQFGGDLLEGLQVDGSPEFAGWLAGQRQRYRAIRTAVHAELATRAPAGSDAMLRDLQIWLELAPFDVRPHLVMLDTLVQSGRVHDAEEHVTTTIRAFEQRGLDWLPLRDAWRAKRTAPVTSAEAAPPPQPTTVSGRRASVAVMPFADRSGEGRSGVADGLTDDVITRLAKLRVLFVIARGTSYALAERGISAREAGQILRVDYVVSGSVRHVGSRLSVTIDLVETETARIVWTEELEGGADETFVVLDEIVNRIVASVAEEIEAAECRRALLKNPSSLDAWEAYHRGLWHMYKFNGPDNHEAETFFQSALRMDPTFARAYAGLSFTHFQNAFLSLTSDRERQIGLAFEAAGRSVDADARDPAAHWAMGRALWLRGEQRDSIGALERSIELSPNFALGHYTVGFVQSQAGDPRAAIEATNYARELSPFDPLQFAMLASRAIAHLRLGETEEAAEWAAKATSRPNAHVHILAIAVESLALAGRRADAMKFVAKIRDRAPGYGVEDFLRAFRFDADTVNLLRKTAKTVGFAG